MSEGVNEIGDAISALVECEEKAGRIASLVAAVEEWCNEAEATVATLAFGSETQSLFMEASTRAETCRSLAANLGVEIEATREFLERTQ